MSELFEQLSRYIPRAVFALELIALRAQSQSGAVQCGAHNCVKGAQRMAEGPNNRLCGFCDVHADALANGETVKMTEATSNAA